MFQRQTAVVLMAIVLLAGCGQPGPRGASQGNDSSPVAPPTITDGKLLLKSEPVGVKGVIEVRKSARDGDEVVVVGRVGGTDKPFTEGRASFLIVDPSLKPCEDGGCDYCETPAEELAVARASVKFVDGQGKTLPTGARELFGIKELTTVVVKGKANRDDKGNLTIVGSGLYVRKDKD
jgi:hypothetical protein